MLCVEQDTKQKQSQTLETKSTQVRHGFGTKQEAQTLLMLL